MKLAQIGLNIPIMMFGSETWVLTNIMRSKLQAIDMKFLRAIKGVTLLDRIRNETIRSELGVKPINQ